jgi:drug/metabolite transporter (DMT)-like permease
MQRWESQWLRAMPVVFVLIWSTGYIAAKFGMPHAPPIGFLTLRFALSLVCFAVWIGLARAFFTPVVWPQGRSQWWHLAVTGVLMHAGYLGGVWMAVKAGMGSALVALIIGLQPVLTALWVSGRGAQHISRAQWLGLLLGLAGLALVVSSKFEFSAGVGAGIGTGAEATAWTLFLASFALLCTTGGALYQKRFVAPCDVRSANTVQLLAAMLVSLPFALLESQPMVFNTPFIGAMAWSVVVLTLGGSNLLYMLIQRGAATAVASLLYLVPPCTAVLAWLLFDEAITWITVAGTALTALGVYLVVKKSS